MAWIAQLPKLESLHLDYTPISDAGFAKLAGHAALRELYLDRTELTDAGIDTLAGLSTLRFIDLYHTLVTEAGVAKLRKALPELKINWNADSSRRGRRT